MPPSVKPVVVHLRIALDEVVPEVWRRVLVPGNLSLGRLHNVFQVAMGWTNSHLHRFDIENASYGMEFDDDAEDEEDENDVTVLQSVEAIKQFLYEYDFGDGWTHAVTVEDATEVSRSLKYAVCLDGQSACPPEDCGGPAGYTELLAVLADPAHPEHEPMRDWVGEEFRPDAFSLATVNAALQQLR